MSVINVYAVLSKGWRFLALVCAAQQTMQAVFGFSQLMGRIDRMENAIHRLADQPCEDETQQREGRA
jgi:hypothetical protein